jgi:CRP-like cAMP-binding protein/RsiW-degrading membrane proteinase PrsW (M82 family)
MALFPYLVVIAIPAVALYVAFVLDVYDTGKSTTVYACLAWGLVGAFGLAYLVNGALLPMVGYSATVQLTAPMIEELLKALILIYFVVQPRFRYVVDGAVYGFAAGIGFSVAENIFYLATGVPDVSLALSRVLSTALMHATASGLCGATLGYWRRTAAQWRNVLPAAGLGLAMLVHLIFNNLLQILDGRWLLLVAIGLGFGGGALISVIIQRGITAEKARFSQTLTARTGVSSGERRAVQEMGSDTFEALMQDVIAVLGDAKAQQVRAMLLLQANVGILQHNLAHPASPRLRAAWEAEIAQTRAKIDGLRRELGLYAMSFLRSVLPENNRALMTAAGAANPTQVHTFDLSVGDGDTIAPEQLAQWADLLRRTALFGDIAAGDLENLCRAATMHDFAANEVLFDAGEAGDKLYVIERGSVQLFAPPCDHTPVLLHVAQAGDVIGELALLDDAPRSAKAVAIAPTRALGLQREPFLLFIQSRPQIVRALLKFMARRARQTTDTLEMTLLWAESLARSDTATAATARQHLPKEGLAKLRAQAVSGNEARDDG